MGLWVILPLTYDLIYTIKKRSYVRIHIYIYTLHSTVSAIGEPEGKSIGSHFLDYIMSAPVRWKSQQETTASRPECQRAPNAEALKALIPKTPKPLNPENPLA